MRRRNIPLKKQFKHLIFGEPKDPKDKGLFHKISLVAFLAWIGFGVDGITSSCYGPMEAYKALGGHYYLSIFLALMTTITIFIISSSYKQIIELFPSGGGGYVVASKLLSPSVGMVSGCALIVDYILTITVSIAAGTDAIFSFLPHQFYHYKIYVSCLIIILIMILNLRGVKESILFVAPVFFLFMITHVALILYAILGQMNTLPVIIEKSVVDFQQTSSQIGYYGIVFILLHAYSLGSGTYTGIEAVSNGMPLIREPRIKEGKKTMNYMAVSLAFMACGLILAYLFYDVQPLAGKTLNALLLERITADWSWGTTFLIITLISEALLLLVAAQTGFLSGPRVLANMAADYWMPSRFTILSERLVTHNGIVLMGGASLILIWIAKGSVAFLVVLYSINVFLTFSLSQLGMIKYWLKNRREEKKWIQRFIINGIGFMLTTFILIIVIVMKFFEGGWLTLVVTSTLVLFSVIIKNQYLKTRRILKRLDSLVETIKISNDISPHLLKTQEKELKKLETAIVLVNGFNGIGLHTVLNIMRFFKKHFKNFIFIQVGVVDAGIFKGPGALREMKSSIYNDLQKYVKMMQSNGYFAGCAMSIGVDLVDELENTLEGILKKYPHSIIFTGQLLFHKETFLTRLLNNFTAFAIEKRMYYKGTPVMVMPIRVDI
jgi:amino acid transporter